MSRPQRPNLRRYHYKIHFPENTGPIVAEFISQIKDVDITYHAAEQLMEDRRGIIPLPTRAELFHTSNTLVEFYEVLDDSQQPTGVMQKALIRVHNLDENYDYSYVLAREGFIVSAWANDKADDHRLSGPTNAYYTPDTGIAA